MRAYTAMLLALLISLTACVHRAPSERMLDYRAGYDMDIIQGETLVRDSSRRTVKSVIAWVHPERLPSGDHFWGAWVSVKIDEPGWSLYVPRYEKEGTFLERE